MTRTRRPARLVSVQMKMAVPSASVPKRSHDMRRQYRANLPSGRHGPDWCYPPGMLPIPIRRLLPAVLLLVLVLPLSAQSPAVEPVDLDAIARIKDEAFERSQVMDTLSYLTDLHGPRLTNSPNMHAAASYVRERLGESGIDVRFEPWGTFGRGWANEH